MHLLRTASLALILAGTGLAAISVASPAKADWDHDGWRGRWYRPWYRPWGWGPGYYYRPPPVYYAPPPVVYAPPPPVYYSPGVSFGFTIR